MSEITPEFLEKLKSDIQTIINSKYKIEEVDYFEDYMELFVGDWIYTIDLPNANDIDRDHIVIYSGVLFSEFYDGSLSYDGKAISVLYNDSKAILDTFTNIHESNLEKVKNLKRIINNLSDIYSFSFIEDVVASC